MTPVEPKIFDPQATRAEDLERAVIDLDQAGVRLACPDDLHAAQLRWPEDCPLSEHQLRAELRTLSAEVRALARRAKALYEGLPEPAELDRDDCDVLPMGVYFTLMNALDFVYGDGLEASVDAIEKALAATPESLRAGWLKRRLAHLGLARLIPAPADRRPAGSSVPHASSD